MHNIKPASLILALLLMNCQTPAKTAAQSKQEQMLESQRALVRNALDSGKPESALESLRALLRERPNDADLHNLMGMTQLALRNATRASKEFRTAYRLDQQIATGLNLSSALLETGDYKEAAHLLTQLLARADKENYPYKERLFNNLGYCYSLQKLNAKAEDWYKQALEENPTFFPAHLELARLYERTNRPALALASYRRSMDFCVVCFEPVQALTAMYVKSARPGEARRLLTQFGRLEGIAPEDRVKAGQMLNQISMSALPAATTSR
jgi:Tfp pilus assembly protein PilF